MTFADDILAARGSENDLGGIITSLSGAIEQAERFVLHDDVAEAGYQLIRSRPSSLLDAMPLCRLPYRKLWIEWRGSVSTASWPVYPTTESNPANRTVPRPVPRRMGCLIEATAADDRAGQMTWAWVHGEDRVNVCPLAANFNWAEDADISADGRAAVADAYQGFARRWLGDVDEAAAEELMKSRPDWIKLAHDPREREAVRGLLRHERGWFSRHARKFLDMMATNATPQGFAKMISAWEGDICGEAAFVTCFVMMLNSRNAVDHEREDRVKLNRARERRGKPTLLPYSVTRLHLSKRLRTAQTQGSMTREQARQHIVRGHFKIRRTGIFWWTPFLRGDTRHPIERKTYEVAQ